MPPLSHSKVFRAGVTAPSLNYETSTCSASVNVRDQSLDIRFNLASKGGGTTQVVVEIGKGDFHAILQEIASKLPESVGVLTDCASIANKKNLELLQEARRVHDNEKERAKKLIEGLEAVEEFVSDKYYEAPVGQDEREEKIKDKLQDVMSTLRELRS